MSDHHLVLGSKRSDYAMTYFELQEESLRGAARGTYEEELQRNIKSAHYRSLESIRDFLKLAWGVSSEFKLQSNSITRRMDEVRNFRSFTTMNPISSSSDNLLVYRHYDITI